MNKRELPQRSTRRRQRMNRKDKGGETKSIQSSAEIQQTNNKQPSVYRDEWEGRSI